jgi:hypothetical protein
MSTSSRHHAHLTVYRGLASPAERTRVARQLCRHAALLDDPLALERWISSLLGRMWERRHRVPEYGGADPMRVLGEPILESVVQVGGPGAPLILRGVAQIDRGPLGLLASELAASLDDVAVPDWIEEVGAATIVQAFATCAPGDGEALMLASEPVGETDHMVAVFISDRLGGIAKHLSLTKLFDPSDPASQPGPAKGRPMDFRLVDRVLASQRVRTAIELSDDAPIRAVGPEFADHRALAIARITPAPLGPASYRPG